VQRIQEIWLPAVAAGVGGEHPVQLPDLHPKRRRFAGEMGRGGVRGYGIPVRRKDDLAVGGPGGRPRDATRERPLGQRLQGGLFASPRLANRGGLPLDLSCVVSATLGQQRGVERLEGGDLGAGDHAVAPVAPHAVLHTPLLVALAGGPEVALKEVVAAQDDQCLLFLPGVPGQEALYRGFQVVVRDAAGDPLNMRTGLHMPLEEGFLALGGEGHDARAPRGAPPQDEPWPSAGVLRQDGQAFTPVHWRISPRIARQGQEDGPPSCLLAALRHMPAYGGLAAPIAWCLQEFNDLMSRLPWLTWHALMLGQARLDHRLVGPQNGGRARHLQGVGCWRRGSDGLLHACACASQVAGDLPHGFVLVNVGSSNLFARFHCDHLLLRCSLGGGAPQQNNGTLIQWLPCR
jgi:hypothetical protein